LAAYLPGVKYSTHAFARSVLLDISLDALLMILFGRSALFQWMFSFSVS
jgi:hypothetical protein